MKILVLSESLPMTLHDGGNLRIFHLMRGMAHMGHKVDLTAFVPAKPILDLGPLDDICGHVEQVTHTKAKRWIQAGLNILSRVPANVSAYSSREMSRRTRGLFRDSSYDLVLAYRLRMAPYALGFRGPKVLDLTDSMTLFSDRARRHADGFVVRMLHGLEYMKLRAYEAPACSPFCRVLITSPVDAQELGLGADQCVILPNGVDLEDRPCHPLAGRKGILFMGNLAYGPNKEAASWMVRELYPKIRNQNPDCRLRIVGPGADSRWEGKGVSLAGPVRDLGAELKQARVLVVPMRRGAGVQNKILDALASGLPVVATPLAASGLELEPDREYMAGGNSEEIVSQTLRVLADDGLAGALTRAGRQLVEKKYVWEKQWATLDRVLNEVLEQGKTTP